LNYLLTPLDFFLVSSLLSFSFCLIFNFLLVTTNPAYSLLLQSIRLDDSAAAATEAERIISAGAVDWDDLLIRAELHSIRPHLGKLLLNVSSEKVPDYVSDNLNEYNCQNLLRQLRNITEFFEVKKLLDEKGITAIPFKGFWLAHKTYGNVADRESTDVDLYINVNDIEKIKEVMFNRGYIEQSSYSGLTFDDIRRESGEYNFEKIENDTVIFHFEFHWGVFFPVYRMHIKIDDLASQIISGQIQNQELSVFSPEANLLLAVIHHGGADAYLRLKFIHDIAAIINREKDLDWSWIINMAKKIHIENLLFTGVRLASEMTGIQTPLQIKSQVEKRRVTCLTKNRLRYMAMPPLIPSRIVFLTGNYLFRIRSRTGFRLKTNLLIYLSTGFFFRYILPRSVRARVLKGRRGIDIFKTR